MVFCVTFPERLVELRQSRDYTQQQVADGIGITWRGYQYYEKDKREPSLHILVALADFYHVSLDYLVGRSDLP